MQKQILGERQGSQPDVALGDCRAIEVLVLTHNQATVQEWLPYHSIRLFPAPVLELYGRTAVEAPRVPKDQSVWFFWKDFLSRK